MVFIVSTTISQKKLNDIQFTIEHKNIDEFSGYQITTLRSKQIAKGLFVYAVKVDSTIFINFASIQDLGCSGVSDNYVAVLFENGLSVIFAQDLADISCHAGSYSMYQVSQDHLDQITQAKKIRIKQSDRTADFEVLDPDVFIKLFKTVQE